jgi:peptide/nickel transport system substrate-binding protein
MRIKGRLRLLAFASVACATVLAACSTSSNSTATGSQSRVNGGIATVALTPGEQFNYIFPMLNTENAIGANIEYSEYLMWRPLYWFGGPNSVGLNTKYSLAYPPTVTHPAGHTLAVIKLKSYRWSDGTPVTSRDVQFWFNLLVANKTNFWGYTPGEFPDNVSKFTVISRSSFSLTFKGNDSAAWLYNELGQLIPLPQHAWDKESATGKVGNYDLNPAGALAVGNFLLGKSENGDLNTYATNPLWKVVDGPFKLISFAASTGDATYVRNTKYSGPATGSIHELRVLSYTSDDAEFDALLSAGGIDYGYIPFNDAAQIARVTADGYKVAAWPTWGITYMSMNFASPQVGAIFSQLYVRQAMQHLINQAGYIDAYLQGYGNPTYGPVPLVPSSKFVSSAEKQNPYPYNPAEATGILRSHGWKINPHGIDVCTRPGSGATDCGAGIAAGQKLSFNLQYSTGTQGVDEEVASLQSAFSLAGIQIAPSGAPFSTVVGNDIPCTKSGCWELNYYGQGWYFDPGYYDPDGSVLFATGGVDNGGSYSNSTADALMNKLESQGLPALYNYENYIAKQLPMLWLPQFDGQISAVNDKLQGVFPQDPDGNIYPENWYFTK